MSITVYFQATNMTPEMYDACLDRLAAAGARAPAGREYHTCFDAEGRLAVVDVWTSLEEFEAFGEILMPILDELGIESPEPQIAENYNIIVKGQRSKAAGG